MDNITLKVNRMCVLKKEMAEKKAELDELEGYFLKLCEDDLKDTKLKSVSYSGTGANRITATVASSLKVIYPSFLKKIFKDSYQDVITEDVKYKVSAPAARMLSGLYLKNYTKMTVAEILEQIAADEKTFEALKKKVRGTNYETDIKNLIAIAGNSEDEAAENAYLVSEAAVWESFIKLLQINEQTDVDAVLTLIDGAVTVEETPKITVGA